MIEHREADLGAVRLHYATSGSGELILFLHGFPEFWYAWRQQLEEFGRDYHPVAPDLRGYNLSSKPEGIEQYGIRHLVDDVRRLADHFGAHRFRLVGHDWGGLVAWAFAATHPDRLSHLAIINAPHPAVFLRELRENPAQQTASRYILTFRSARAEQLLSANDYAALAAMVIEPGLQAKYFTEDDRQAYLAAWSQPGALTGGLNYYRAAQVGPPDRHGHQSEERLTAELPSLTVPVPTLVIWGERDVALLSSNLNGLADYVPDLTVRRIPDGTHWVIHEQPDRVNAYLREFFSRS